MSLHYEDEQITLHHGDCLEVLRQLPDASVDAVVTDPPYGLEFMGKEWDGADGFRRSLNPADAGRDNAFGCTSKTSPEYRTASKAQASRRQEGGISQASGPSFLGGLNPKCLVCDRWQRGSSPCACEAPEWTQERLVRLHSFQEWCEVWSRECLRVLRPGGHMLAFGGTRTFHRLASAVEDAGFEIRDSIAWMYGSGFPKSRNLTDDDGERTGWGTALKPAFEPIVVARKPLAGTVAANVLAHGTGALNIDACRVGFASDADKQSATPGGKTTSLNGALAGKVQTCETPSTAAPTTESSTTSTTGSAPTATSPSSPRTEFRTEQGAGRWPANVILDGSQAAALDQQAPETGGAGKASGPSLRNATDATDAYGARLGFEGDPAFYGDTGGASRFFYVAKADQTERVKVDGIAHPTVKPLDLMRWLVRLVTPTGGTVLEPFAGSGTTVEACLLEGFQCIAIERETDYLPLIVQRINRRRDPVAAVKATGEDGGLFDLLGDIA